LIIFITVILTFVWREDLTEAQRAISPRGKKAFHVILTFILFAGIGYLGLIIRSLRRYGEHMDKKWTEAIKEKIAELFPPDVPSPMGVESHFLTSDPPVPHPTPFPSHQRAIPASLQHQSQPVAPVVAWAHPSSSQASLVPSPAQRPGMALGANDILRDPIEIIRFGAQRTLPEVKVYIAWLAARGLTETMWLKFSEVCSSSLLDFTPTTLILILP
jgi:hypothetical protein